jgi:hypothetical protein
MANSFRIMSLLNGLVMDVFQGSTSRGTQIETWTQNSPASANQLWTFEQSDVAGYFFIKSNLGNNLVVDIKGASTTPATEIETWTQNSPNNEDNQLWTFTSLFPTGAPPPAMGYIQSHLAPNLVIDVFKGNAAKGTPLISFPKNSPESLNQLWFVIPDPNNSYDPQIMAVTMDFEGGNMGFRITGTGFQPLTPVLGHCVYSGDLVGGPNDQIPISPIAIDLGGGFERFTPLIDLRNSTGILTVILPFSFPLLPNGGVTAWRWDESTFTKIR